MGAIGMTGMGVYDGRCIEIDMRYLGDAETPGDATCWRKAVNILSWRIRDLLPRTGALDMVGLRPADGTDEVCWLVGGESDDDIEEWAARARAMADGEAFCAATLADYARDYDVLLFLRVAGGQLAGVRAQLEECVDDAARERMEIQVGTLMPGRIVRDGSRLSRFDMLPTGLARDDGPPDAPAWPIDF